MTHSSRFHRTILRPTDFAHCRHQVWDLFCIATNVSSLGAFRHEVEFGRINLPNIAPKVA